MTDRPKIKMPKIVPIQYPTRKLNLFGRFLRWVVYTRKWRVVEDYYFILPDGIKIIISEGFEFDGASVPKPLRSLLSPTGCLFISGLVHDHSYRYNRLIGVNDDGTLFEYMPDAGKTHWDKLFREIANQTNGLTNINKMAHAMLSVFGFWSWNQARGKIPTLSLMLE